MRLHKDLTPERWFSFSLNMQLANVGADVSRAIRWKNEDNKEFSKNAFERALELLSLTILDPKLSSAALREMCRVRECLIDYFLFDNKYGSSDTSWETYFYYFSYLAAAERGV